jgi:electron transport complex protein RnfB
MAARLVEALLDALPQTQCRRCGYAEAIAEQGADVNRCPPGGAAGVARLARLSGRPVLALDPECGSEAPRSLAVVDEAWCIGCALCLKACPVDAIVGAAKSMHVVLADHCTGCELCVPVCPVDCISLVNASGAQTGWDAWDAQRAAEARARHARHAARFADAAASAAEDRPASAPRRQETVAAAVARARAARSAR